MIHIYGKINRKLCPVRKRSKTLESSPLALRSSEKYRQRLAVYTVKSSVQITDMLKENNFVA